MQDTAGEVFSFGGLLIPMIRYQCFFEGGGPTTYPGIDTFRIEPEHAVTFFSIEPGVPVTSVAKQPKAVSILVDPFNFLVYSTSDLKFEA